MCLQPYARWAFDNLCLLLFSSSSATVRSSESSNPIVAMVTLCSYTLLPLMMVRMSWSQGRTSPDCLCFYLLCPPQRTERGPGGLAAWQRVAIRPRWPPAGPRWDGLMGLPAALHFIAAAAPWGSGIKALPAAPEPPGCGWRSSPMNSASYVGQTPSARRKHAHYQFMAPPNAPRSFRKKIFKAPLSLFSFSGVNFDNSNFRSMTSCESHAGERSPVSEASRPLRLFDQRLGCEFRRSESGSEAPRGPPFTPATGGG